MRSSKSRPAGVSNPEPSVPETVVISHSEIETAGVAYGLASTLNPGTTVLLIGELGAGKTAFVRGLAEGLGLDPHQVSSPTFTLIQEYRGRITLHHADLYRITADEAEDLGLQELAGPDSVVAVEWADKLTRPVGEAVLVRLEDLGNDTRRITIAQGALTPPDSSALPS
ncbi:MAG: tRNA (adenosine(37)-N6)-threonylcarbamoyltransferase complex ATPase subunit type 1 TsaE [Acidobacteria bacterium]|nr:tRNA (adenosine(37)-N6)-threonylcarbamoyltransferase complex ATPase subunit type 1 TsaE [Acidobacteriota bacterium]MBI3262472.1 tRNA (adenosine(37)-N6)-threonylcarbamoyltransferase complex ATPase subunit type 1 TsaE [Acidobacteriota bacterium]